MQSMCTRMFDRWNHCFSKRRCPTDMLELAGKGKQVILISLGSHGSLDKNTASLQRTCSLGVRCLTKSCIILGCLIYTNIYIYTYTKIFTIMHVFHIYIDITYLQQNISTIDLRHHQSGVFCVLNIQPMLNPGNLTDPPTTQAPPTALCRGDEKNSTEKRSVVANTWKTW